MASTLLTLTDITREAIRLWKNTNSFLKMIDHQYDDSFAKEGAKIGTALRIRLPNDYVVRTGSAASPQDTAESSSTLTVATQKGVDIDFSSVDRTMSLDDYSSRVMEPMVNNLAGDVAATVMSGANGGISNFVSKVDGSSVIIAPDAETWLTAGAKLDGMSAPKSNRYICVDRLTQARTVASLTGLFNPSGKVSAQFNTGEMTSALGFDWMMDQTVLIHTTSTWSGSKTVNGADQTGTTITVNAVTGGFLIGDVITFAGVNAVNRITKEDTGELAQFVLTATALTGATSLSIYPAIIPPDSGGNKVQYQTVTASPANSAAIVCVSPSAGTFRGNFAYHKDAVTIATADLEMPGGVWEAARENFDGVAMRSVTAYQIGTDRTITRLDVLFGYLWIRPEWACWVADAV